MFSLKDCINIMTCIAASEGGYTGVESMYYSVRGSQRLAPQFTPNQLQLIEEGKEGMEKLWAMYQNKDIWKVEKTMVNILFFLDSTHYPLLPIFLIFSCIFGEYFMCWF